jgi:epsilon-lactone hydrolase
MPRSIENTIRAGFPLIRLMQTIMSPRQSARLLKYSMPLVRLDKEVTRESISAGGVPCEWITPKNSRAEQVLLYLHGGGFVFGQTPLHMHMGAWLAKKMGIRLLMVDYRLAPAHPFPAALEDCVTAYRWLLDQGFSAGNIVIAGDSAGGNLTITTMMQLRGSGIPLPAAAACLSPVTDLTEKSGNGGNIKDPLLPPKAVKFYSVSYLGDNDPRNPLISPVFGDLHGLPPLLVHVGEEEILRQDALRIVDRAKAAGVDARLEAYPRMWHVWQVYLALPQAVQSLEDISQFLVSHLEQKKH